MKFKNGWMVIAAFAAGAMMFTPTSYGVPAENECLTVTGSTTLSSSATYGNLIVNSGATLTIAAGVVLTLDGISDTCTNYVHQIDGSVILNGSGAIIRFINTSQTVQGAGDIDGQNNDAKIEIGSGLRLRNHLLIQGHLKIDRAGSSGTATFENYANSTATGIVSANATGGSSGSPKILELSANLVLDDTTASGYRPIYEANGDNYSRLLFNREALSLEGDFVMLACSDYIMNVNIVTNGVFNTSTARGTVDVATNVCFEWNEIAGIVCSDTNYISGGSCP